MRGVKLEPPKNHKETKPIEHYQEKHPDFLAELGKALGFTDDVFAELDRIETEARAKQNENSMSADDDEIVFNLDDKDEFDNDFVQEQIDDDEFNF
ncbi:hypothetical protein [Moraxella lacunata]|uniref:Uncharacterized protein n=2 Tax=Moraxella lacunata TaxID=477 RepID=A0A1V4GYS0_MORLA|nr:hypothetical protein [Moraxella lacunata]OPH37757.1 hypothetical protein B5J94_05200 [Moraxella lacunata]